ncbi:hypothetical protein PGTUg99_022489 [Puccinia graminis f. sp. tritici]|uniref:Uncharacterized protein n=1 Tax=Puccinia graminis f. sp. tritici TaxID=56615 RepID=A0A5B0S6Q8_PUCGR|nr:hypothetical protein PGTUg99_022489 [Puccinia graminis f. sp. tritici]
MTLSRTNPLLSTALTPIHMALGRSIGGRRKSSRRNEHSAVYNKQTRQALGCIGSAELKTSAIHRPGNTIIDADRRAGISRTPLRDSSRS